MSDGLRDRREELHRAPFVGGSFLLAIFAFGLLALHTVGYGAAFNPFIFVLYIIFALVAFFVYRDSRDDSFNFGRLFVFFLISIATFLWPWLVKFGLEKFTSIGVSQTIGPMLTFLAGGWLLYLLFHPTDRLTRAILLFLFIPLWVTYIVFMFVLPLLPGVDIQTPGGAWTGADLRDNLAVAWHRFTDSAEGVGTKVVKTQTDFFKGRTAAITQDYYTGTVDQSNEGPPVGVFLTDGKPYYTVFNPDSQDVIVSATLRYHTYNEKPFIIKNECWLQAEDYTSSFDRNRIYSGKVLPQTVQVDYTGEFQERTELDCSVQHEEWKAPKPTLPAGRTLNVNVVYNASFPFETWGYAEYSFMQRELKQSFINDNQDPALELGVSRVLNAKYTPGPVAVGMPKETQPYAYDATAPIDLPPFGVTFSNAWMGKGGIVKFTSLRIYVPEYFELDASQCLLPVAPSNTVKKVPWDENTAYNYYEFENIYLPPAETFVTIKCPLRVIEPNKILGSSGAGKYTFFVQANYDYYLTMTTPVMLRRDPVKPEPNAPCQANTLTCKSGGMDCTCLYQDINKYSWQCRATMEGLTTACEPNTLN